MKNGKGLETFITWVAARWTQWGWSQYSNMYALSLKAGFLSVKYF